MPSSRQTPSSCQSRHPINAVIPANAGIQAVTASALSRHQPCPVIPAKAGTHFDFRVVCALVARMVSTVTKRLRMSRPFPRSINHLSSARPPCAPHCPHKLPQRTKCDLFGGTRVVRQAGPRERTVFVVAAIPGWLSQVRCRVSHSNPAVNPRWSDDAAAVPSRPCRSLRPAR